MITDANIYGIEQKSLFLKLFFITSTILLDLESQTICLVPHKLVLLSPEQTVVTLLHVAGLTLHCCRTPIVLKCNI